MGNACFDNNFVFEILFSNNQNIWNNAECCSLMELVTSSVMARSAHICNFNTDMINQNYWVSDLGPSSGILETRKHNVSETLTKRPNRVFPPHLRTETDPVSETLCFLVSRVPNDG
jgi:hypothetical protein